MNRILRLGTLFTLWFALVVSVENSYFEGRSANIVVQPKNIQDDAAVFLSSQFDCTALDTIHDVELTSIISSQIGGPFVSHPVCKSSSLWKKQRANLLVTIDAVGSDMDISNFQSIKNFKQMKLSKTSYPQDSIATLTTISTGASPSTHGIIAKQWQTQNGTIEAFKSQALPQVSSLSDTFNQLFRGKSIVFSGSYDFQMAASMSVHQILHHQNPTNNNFGFYFNEQNKRFESIYGDKNEDLTLSKSTLLSSFVEQLSVEIPRHLIPLLLEIQYLNSTITTMQTKYQAQINDDIPDLFQFHFSSIKSIANKYGVQSEQVIESMKILDVALTNMISRINNIYEKEIAIEVAFIGSRSPLQQIENYKQVTEKFFQIIKKHVSSKQAFQTFFPMIYLKKSATLEDVCETLQYSMISNVEVVCIEPQTTKRSVMADPYVVDIDMEYFQILLWASIGLILIVAATIYSMCAMDTGADSLLYRMTSPKQHTT